MAKKGEREYFKKIGPEGVTFTLNKPFSDPQNTGGLLHDIAAIFTLLPEGQLKILDLGCGSGWTSAFYAQAGHEVTGVDIAPEAVSAATQHFARLNNLRFVVGDYDKLKFNEDFDVAIFFDSLHHAEDENVALRAAHRALKPGGIIIACEPGVGHSKTPKSREAMEKYGVNERDMPPKKLKPLLKKAGFSSVKVYAYPAMSHRALYKNRNGTLGTIRNNTFVRGGTAVLFATLLRRNHGIVAATK